MGLYDIIDEITEKQVTKTESGDNRIWGVMVGIVAENFDPNSKGGQGATGSGSNSGASAMDGRVCVTIPTRDRHKTQDGEGDTTNVLQWARVAMPSGGSKWGHYFLPERGDQVLLAFEGGNIEKPYVIGCLQKHDSTFLSQAVDKDNQFKKIVTLHGSNITFEDNKGDEKGAKDKMTLETAGQAHQILMDNENSLIRMGGKPNGKNYLEMTTKDGDGTLTIKVENSLTIKVGDNITMTMNGASGDVTIKCTSFKADASDTAKINGNSSVAIESSRLDAKASTSINLKSDGTAAVSGSTLNLG